MVDTREIWFEEGFKEGLKQAFKDLEALEFDYIEWEIRLNEKGIIKTINKEKD